MVTMRKLFLAMGLLFYAVAAAFAGWSVERMNEVVSQTNFIVGTGCSGTLISLKYKLILTNHHCIRSYVRVETRDEVVNGVVKKLRKEDLRDVEVSQRAYANYRKVGSASWQSVIVARWKESDLALLQIRAESIPHKVQSDVFPGKKVYRGETVYAVGNPMMLDATISRGIVSSTNRMFRVPWANNKEVPFTQIDAAITSGSSGGALYNEAGMLIGVPAAGARQAGIGLAIPFSRIQSFLTKHCYRDVWDRAPDVKDHDTCMTARKAAAEKKKKKAD